MTISVWQIEFAQPLWFALLAALPLLLIYWRRSLLNVSTARKILSYLLRGLLILLVAAALAGPKATGPADLHGLVTKVTTTPAVIPPPPVVLTGPDRARAGEPFTLDVLVRSRSAETAEVDLLRNGQPPLHERIELKAGDNYKAFPVTVVRPSHVVYTARVKSDQFSAATDGGTAGCAVIIGPPPRVLLVESRPLLAEDLKNALAGDNIEVEVQPQLPAGSLAAYDLIMLSNVPASALPELRMKALQTYVHDDRGGLIAIGGDHSFTVGGYRHSLLEEILPVISEERKDRPKPTLAMVLVVDISGSMNDTIAGNAKIRNIDLAKEALRTAVKQLGPRDQVGVLVFEDRSRWIWPLSAVSDKQKIIDKIDTIEAEGSTNMYPPLEKAYLALHEAFADLKHIIVMTDGLGEPGDFEGLAEKIAAEGITMTTVGIGAEPAQGFLKSIADRAKGRSIMFPDASNVPDFFKNETNLAAKTGISEEPFFPRVVDDAPVLRGLDMAHAPTLLGYVDTQARREARVVLDSRPGVPGAPGEPILAFWRYGGGASAAFTSDIQSRWAAPWLKWSGFGKFWVQLARQMMRHDLPKTLQLATDAADGRLFFTLDAANRDGRFINGADASVAVSCSSLNPGEGKSEGSPGHTVVPLTQIAPGRYAGSLAAGQGTYWLDCEVRRDGKRIDSIQRGTVVLRVPDTAAKVEGSIQPVEKTGTTSTLLWHWLLGAGLVMLVLDLAVRRTAKPQ
jgi:Ca-activated chloride channel homolog